MILPSPLVPGILLRRYKRFLADVKLESGQTVTAHCPNTGSMLGVAEPGCRVWLTHQPSESRKYAHGWELTELASGVLVGINTHRSNALVREVIEHGRLPSLGGYTSIVPECRYGSENSRVDFLLQANGLPDCYVEVKNVTAAVNGGVAVFPDAVSVRATKHLRELADMVRQGHRAALVYCVQRQDVEEVQPADAIDPAYGAGVREAMAAGVEFLALAASVTPDSIVLHREIQFLTPPAVKPE